MVSDSSGLASRIYDLSLSSGDASVVSGFSEVFGTSNSSRVTDSSGVVISSTFSIGVVSGVSLSTGFISVVYGSVYLLGVSMGAVSMLT